MYVRALIVGRNSEREEMSARCQSNTRTSHCSCIDFRGRCINARRPSGLRSGGWKRSPYV